MDKNVNNVIRWILLPIVILAVFLIVSFLNRYINPADRSSLNKLAQESIFGKWLLGLLEDGPNHLLAALGGIYAGYGIAPSHKKETILISSSVMATIFIALIIIYIIGISKGVLSYENTISAFCGCIGSIIGCIIGIIASFKINE